MKNPDKMSVLELRNEVISLRRQRELDAERIEQLEKDVEYYNDLYQQAAAEVACVR